MSENEVSANNDEQIEYWNGAAGRSWTESQERLDRLLAPLSDIAVAKAAAVPGERVLDVGCGCGATTLAMLQLGANVCGLDISAPMLARARQRTRAFENVAFVQGDAAVHTLTPDHDLVFSRFGVMFFADPVGAFNNLRRALTPTGRLVFLCWQAPQENDWIYVSGKAIAPYLPIPATPPDPKAPGPFAFADAGYLRDVLQRAGFVDIAIDPVTALVHLADTLDEAVEFQGQIGPVARALAELEGERREQALAAARAALALHMTHDGLKLGAAVWLVSAGSGHST